MKHLIALVISVFTVIAVNAQNGPQFKFKSETHDFGTIKEGPTVKYDFEFTNIGKEPLIIYDATADCGCTKPSWPKQPILPGQNGKITVEYNTQGRVSPFSKYIYIKSNAPGQSGKERFELKIKGTVVNAKEPEPKG